ncbi:MAG: ABC transporter substrate-binding protein [Syntrophales bacterium]|nr:ABC transporter substrate-binding protein [Syntrophales bacterium]
MIYSAKYRTLLVLCIALPVLALTGGCGGTNPPKDGSAKLEKVRYAAFRGLNGVAVQMGVEKGFFRDAGIEVEFIDTKDPISILASGEADFADTNTNLAITGAGRGAPIKIVASFFRTKIPFYLIGSPAIRSIGDLRGKKVGIGAFGTGLEICARTILARNGLKAEDVTFIANGRHSQAFASLESGQVDATMISEPFVTLGEKTGKARLLARGWDYMPDYHTGALTASDAFIDKHPELLRKMIQAYFRSQEYAKGHPDEYLEYAQKLMKLDRDVLAAALKREMVLWENKPDVNMAALNETQRAQVAMGFQEKAYDLGKIVDLRFIPKAGEK